MRRNSAISSVGRAIPLHGKGREFEPLIAHKNKYFKLLLEVFIFCKPEARKGYLLVYDQREINK